jgi:hypothetical protein
MTPQPEHAAQLRREHPDWTLRHIAQEIASDSPPPHPFRVSKWLKTAGLKSGHYVPKKYFEDCGAERITWSQRHYYPVCQSCSGIRRRGGKGT